MLRLHFDAQGALLDSARECEAEVFLRWFGNTRAQLDDEYGPYEEHSVFLVLADEDEQAVGAVRLIAPGGPGFKTFADVGQQPWGVDGLRSARAAGIDLSSTWEVATLGVRAGAAGGGTAGALALYHGLMTVARVNRMSTFVAILDERVRRLLGSVGITTRALPGTATAPYLGSDRSTPVYSHYAPMVDAQRRDLPDAYRLVTLGIGLDGVSIPPEEQFRLQPRRRVLDVRALEHIPTARSGGGAGLSVAARYR
ncbi:hypothetical protein GCM10027446_28030 [Angustibacter peucedani]